MIRKFYDMEVDGHGGWILTTDPDYDPNKKNWLQMLLAFIKQILKNK